MKFIMACLVTVFLASPLVGCTVNKEKQELRISTQKVQLKESDNEIEEFGAASKKNNQVENNQENNNQVEKNIALNKDKKEPQRITGKKVLNVPLIKQNPELKYGCEVTSLTMLLQYAGINVDKMQLAKQMQKDNDKLIKSKSGDIVYWGDPDEGFVGDVTGKQAGYAIFDKPLEKLLRQYLGDRTVNLTGRPFDELLKQVSNGKPVIVWTTGDYRLPDRYESWKHKDKKITTPLDLHAVVLVGYDDGHLYINDPLSGRKDHMVEKETFIASWKALKKRALSYN